eukprot:SAG11_NODE_12253_length_713_cov_1.008143_2_plen_84_part_00
MAADLSPRTLHDVYLRPWREYKQAGGRGASAPTRCLPALPPRTVAPSARESRQSVAIGNACSWTPEQSVAVEGAAQLCVRVEP